MAAAGIMEESTMKGNIMRRTMRSIMKGNIITKSRIIRFNPRPNTWPITMRTIMTTTIGIIIITTGTMPDGVGILGFGAAWG